MERKRVFIGLPAGNSLMASAAAFRRDHKGLKVRWIHPENLHVTMVPPWELDDPAPVCAALEAIASMSEAVPVSFHTVSPGPDPRHPRLIWATGAAPETLSLLATNLKSAFGDGKEAHRDFLLHLTIARINRQETRAVASTKLHESIEWHGLLDTLCLYESVLKPGGAEYRILCRSTLSRSMT